MINKENLMFEITFLFRRIIFYIIDKIELYKEISRIKREDKLFKKIELMYK